MKKQLLLICLIALSINSYSQNKLWEKVSEGKISTLEKFERANTPEKFELFSLNFSELKIALQNAPLDTSGTRSNIVVAFPDNTGKISNYVIYEAPVMEKALSDKYPDIKSYVGKGIDDKSASIRFSTSLFGLHLMATSGEAGTFYIDTYTKNLNNYIVYNRKDIKNSRSFSCLVEDSPEEIVNDINIQSQRATDGRFRQYRLAMACTIEYAAYHVNAAGLNAGTLVQKKAAVLSAMVVTMTRVNGIYEKDMSLRMNLIGNNDSVIFITTDSFTNTDANALINESQTVIDGAIGSANYDIGHTVSTGGGGLASLNSPCTANKARGITGSPAPVGDPYDVDYVAHEMGHQFGGPHTFSGTGGNCSGNGSAANAVEPASGSTIMAYAGICGPDVQPNSDPYFHAVSIASMNAFMIGTGNCAANTLNNNAVPVITALTNYTIPKSTAYVLTGSATDPDPTASLTYCWEQTNAASGTNLPTSTQTSGPVYRSLNPTTSPKRYFPKLSEVVSGNLTPTWEVTPSVARTLNFALTVRDNQTSTGGQTARANMTVTVGAAGPFNVTSQTTNITWVAGTQETITWNVVGTTAAPYNTTNVNILFSSDNGVTFTTLLANTANDGTQQITVPAVSAAFCKVIVESVGNIFYAVNAGNIAIGYTVTVNTVCNTYAATPAANIVEQTPLAYQNFSVAVPALPGFVSDVNVNANISHRVNQLYIGMNHPDNTFVQLFQSDNYACTNPQATLITKFDDAGANFVCTGAAGNNTYKPTNSLSVLNGKTTAGNWFFRVADITAGTSGTLNSFSFEICAKETIVTPLGTTQEYEFTDLELFPNPNNGSFTIRAKSSNSNNINISVDDIRGRNVLNKKYSNNGLFDQIITLQNVETGVYLVTITDGEKKSVKRIVIE